ncbi:MAG: hypothetical protein ABIJ08_00195 [Nanoarchaeota archaeon]
MIYITEQLKESIVRAKNTFWLGIHPKDSDKAADDAMAAYEYLVGSGLLDTYPPVIDIHSVERLADVRLLVQNLDRSLDETLTDPEIERTLSISPTSRCKNMCICCETDSVPEGHDLDYSLLENVDPAFFKIFSVVHFGHDGDPLLVSSTDRKGRIVDFSDYVGLLHQSGITKFILDTKTLKDDPIKKEVYKRLMALIGSSEDIHFTQRISFNLYSPGVYGNENPLDKLRSEFLPLFYSAREFADEIIINTQGSYKYSTSHIFKTVQYLCSIMEDEGYKAVRCHFPIYLFKDEPDFETKLAGCRKYKETAFMIEGSRQAFARAAFEGTNEIINKYGGNTANSPRQYDLIPTFFIHKDTLKQVKFRYANTMNMGRWAHVRDKGRIITSITESAKERKSRSPRPICGAFLTKNIFLDSKGEVYRCPMAYKPAVRLGNISEPWSDLLQRWDIAHKSLQMIYRSNLRALVDGAYNGWACGRER